MTSFETPAVPASLTAFVLDIAGRVPPLDPRVRETFTRDEGVTRAARALAEESFISSITVSDADDPRLEVPTVLLFSKQSWEIARSGVGLVAAGQRYRGSRTWHDAFPTADGRYLLVPDVHRPDAVSFYRVTRDEKRAVYDYRVGAVSRRAADDEILWDNEDESCWLVRYVSGQLECFELNCKESCGGEAEVDDSGVEHLPCGCPQ